MSGGPRARGLADIPPEILFERVLPLLPDKALLALSATNKVYHELCNDESLWLHRTRQTFAYNPHTLAPPNAGSGWSKRLYIGLSRPEVYVWGCGDNDRLGLPERRSAAGGRIVSYNRRVTTPASLLAQFKRKEGEGGGGRSWTSKLADDLRDAVSRGLITGEGNEADKDTGDVGIVEIQAGGWSFAARDMEGRVWVWGQLDGELPNWRSTGWDNKNERVPEPTRLPLPCRAEAISVGRSHMLILDEDNLIWEMAAWGRAYHHTAAALTSPLNPGSTRRPHHIVQLSTGWTHSACLTSSGKIYVWFPFTQAYADALTGNEALNGPLGAREDGNENRAIKWGIVGGDVVLELEAVPARPSDSGVDGENAVNAGSQVEEDLWEAVEKTLNAKTREDRKKIIKISSGHEFIVALKANGEVWFLALNQNRHARWEYLPHFSSPRISHITAQFTSLTSYSTSSPSAVHHGRIPDHRTPGFGMEFRPDHLPALQDKGVIQVAIGDYHCLALTSRGEVYAWGQGDAGQLGLGERGTRGQRVVEPLQVRFRSITPSAAGGGGITASGGGDGEEGEPFVFAIAAAGWHTGALVLGEPKAVGADKGKVKGKKKADSDPEMPSHAGGAGTGATRSMPGAFPGGQPSSLFGPNVDRAQHQGGPRPGGSLPFFRIGFPGAQQIGTLDLEEPIVAETRQIQGLDMLLNAPVSQEGSTPAPVPEPGSPAGDAPHVTSAVDNGGIGPESSRNARNDTDVSISDGEINLIARQTRRPLLDGNIGSGTASDGNAPDGEQSPGVRSNRGGRVVGDIDPLRGDTADM